MDSRAQHENISPTKQVLKNEIESKNNSEREMISKEQSKFVNHFKLSAYDLEKIVNGYRTRTVSEFVELTLLNDNGGVEGLAKILGVDLKTGITGKDNQIRIEAFGENRRIRKRPKTVWEIFCNVFEDFMLRILFVASIVSIIIEVATAEPEERALSWIDGFGIFIAVAIVVIFSTSNEYAKQNQFQKLNEKADASKLVTVLRNGEWLENKINEDELLVGDIIKLGSGDNIPADGVIITAKAVEVDESQMTGESDAMKKGEISKCAEKFHEMADKNELTDMNVREIPSPILLSGTQVSVGEATCIVISVGELSCMGKIMKKIQGDDEEDEEQTPLQEKLEAIAGDIGKLGLIVAIATVVALFVRFFITRGIKGGWSASDVGLCFEFLVLGITVLAVAIPEGLPLAVTIALAYSVQKMYQQNNLVKHMISCETMGGANNICTDKTGTLTANQMNLQRICFEGIVKDFDPNQKTCEIKAVSENPESFQLLKESICCNTTATRLIGQATEKALVLFIEKFNIDVIKERENLMGQEYERFPFNSKRKKMSTIFFKANCPSKHRLHTKGTVKIILNACKYYLGPNNKIIKMDDSVRDKFISVSDGMNKKALRTLALAYKDLDLNEGGPQHKDQNKNGEYIVEEDNFVLIALVGIRDTLRMKVMESVDKCHKAGITVRMVTGDNPTIATVIGLDCHILPHDFTSTAVMEGKKFYELLGGLKKVCEKCDTETCQCENPSMVEKVANMDKFKEIKDSLRVIAYSRPEDKYLLVTALKELDEIVAVTGDGTNDAMALKKSNVGFAMGIAGTAIAKNAAHIILLDDDFSSIIIAILWGRNIYESIQKFLQFQVSVNIVALASAFISACVITESILRPIQLLWVNLVMDSLASLALATDEPTDDLLLKPPYKKDDYIVTKVMMKHIFSQAIYQVIILFIILFAGEHFIPEDNQVIENIPYSVNGRIRAGRRYGYNGDEDLNKDNLHLVELYSKAIYHKIGPSRHFTIFYATFIFLQIFNEFNSRKLHDELNIFLGLNKNYLAMGVIAAETFLTVIFIEFGNRIFGMCPKGMTWYQWFIVIAFSSGSLLLRFLIIFVDQKICFEFGNRLLREGEQPLPQLIRHPTKNLGSRKKSSKVKRSLVDVNNYERMTEILKEGKNVPTIEEVKYTKKTSNLSKGSGSNKGNNGKVIQINDVQLQVKDNPAPLNSLNSDLNSNIILNSDIKNTQNQNQKDRLTDH